MADILQWMASGMSQNDILEDYPLLKSEHIHAPLAFAANRETMTQMVTAL